MSDHYGDLRLKEANKHLSDVLEDVTKKEESIFEKGLDLLARPFTCWIDFWIDPESSVVNEVGDITNLPVASFSLSRYNNHYNNKFFPFSKPIKPLVGHKPHITFVHGYWRLSNLSDSCLYHKTHAFIYNLNSVIHHEKSKISKV
jgi:hypothetical protein